MASTIIDLNQAKAAVDDQLDQAHTIFALLEGIKALAGDDHPSIAILANDALQRADRLSGVLDECGLFLAKCQLPATLEG